MEPNREDLIASLDELEDAIVHAADVLKASVAANRDFRESIVEGQSVADAFAAFPSIEVRAAVDQELKKLESVRHRNRLAVFSLGLAEGLSIGELSRLYGFSRQLGQRFAHEARGGTAETTTE